MQSDNLRAHYAANQPAGGGWSREMQLFLTLAAHTPFEMRYQGEERWYPAPAEDVARTLSAYHTDLRGCLDRLLDGEEIASRLAWFRVAQRRRI